MIFAAGLGTRLRPLTDRMPKALVRVGGRTLLDIAIERLQKAGSTLTIVNAHHFADQIADHLKTLPGYGTSLLISDESDKLLDTGGGLRHAARLFRPDETVITHNVDILSNADLHALCAAHKADATLLVSQRQTQRYLLFDHSMRLVGWTNTATGEVRTPYPDLDIAKCRRLAFAGIQTVSPTLTRQMDGWPDKFGIIDFYIRSCRDIDIRGYQQTGLQILDVGKTASLPLAESFLDDNN